MGTTNDSAKKLAMSNTKRELLDSYNAVVRTA